MLGHEMETERSPSAHESAGGVGDDASRRLRPLGELPEYDVADEDPDIRGWRVTAADGACVGCVRELIVDTVAMEVRYADVALSMADEPRVLLPLGVLRLDDGVASVRVDGLDAGRVHALPRWNGATVDDAYERALCAHIVGDAPVGEGEGALFDTREFWGHWRASRAGTAFLVEMGRLRRGSRRRAERRGATDRRVP